MQRVGMEFTSYTKPSTKKQTFCGFQRMSGKACALAISRRHFKHTVGRGMQLMIGQCSEGV